MGMNEVAVVEQTIEPPSEDANYVYQRADGTIEQAMDAQDAIARCPVLGKLAIESPDQANLLLELAAEGQQMLAAQAEAEEQAVSSPDKLDTKTITAETIAIEEPAAEPSPELSSVIRANMAELTGQPEQEDGSNEARSTATLRPNIDELHMLQELQAAAADTDATIFESSSAETSDVPVDATKEEEGSHKHAAPSRQVEHAEQSILPEPVKIKDEGLHDIDMPEHSLGRVTSVQEPWTTVTDIQTARPEDGSISRSFTDEIVVDQTSTYIEDSTQTDEPNNKHESLPADSEAVFFEDSSEPEADINDSERWFDAEAIEAYEEIQVLINLEATPVDPANVSSPDQDFVAATEVDKPPSIFSDFDALVEPRFDDDQPTPLELIIEHANEQPLEQTLSQFVKHLSSEKTETPELNVVTEILNDLEKILPDSYQEKEIVNQITPEITEKLLELLNALGYEEPKKALISCVAEHKIEPLIMTLQNIAKFNEDKRREMSLLSMVFTATDDDDSSRLRFGRMLLGLIARRTFEPAS